MPKGNQRLLALSEQGFVHSVMRRTIISRGKGVHQA